jgi:GT2 family glycosyltransferase
VGCPSGDAADWQTRYQPLIDSVIVHRTVASPRLTVVVVAWRTPDELPSCLESVRTAGVPPAEVEVLLVDNGGLEPIRPRLAELVDVEIRMKANVGLCSARNLAAATARAELIAFIDDDGVLGSQALAAALEAFADERVVAMRGRVVAKRHPYFSAIPNTYDRGEQIVDTLLDAEGNSAVRRWVFLDAGGFGTETPHEGASLSFRLAYGTDRRIVYVPGMVLHHDFCDSWHKYFRKSFTRPRRLLKEGAEPEFVAYMAHEEARPFPRTRRPPAEAAAGFVLRNAMVSIRWSAERLGLLRDTYIETVG